MKKTVLGIGGNLKTKNDEDDFKFGVTSGYARDQKPEDNQKDSENQKDQKDSQDNRD